jgi:hypothetical protein
MQRIKVKYNQTNLDIALMAFGDAEKVFDLPNLNNASITDDLEVGVVIENIPIAEFNKKGIAATMNKQQFIPASKKDNYENLHPEGVDYWAIESDFIIS